MSESELVFSRCKFEEAQWRRTVTSKERWVSQNLCFQGASLKKCSDFEQWLRTVTSKERWVSQNLCFCRTKCSNTLRFRSIVEQSAAKHCVFYVFELLSSKVHQKHDVFQSVVEQSAAKHNVLERPVTPEQPIRVRCSKTPRFWRCCRAKCSQTRCFWAPSHSGAADSSIQCLRRWICRQVRCFRRCCRANCTSKSFEFTQEATI